MVRWRWFQVVPTQAVWVRDKGVFSSHGNVSASHNLITSINGVMGAFIIYQRAHSQANQYTQLFIRSIVYHTYCTTVHHRPSLHGPKIRYTGEQDKYPTIPTLSTWQNVSYFIFVCVQHVIHVTSFRFFPLCQNPSINIVTARILARHFRLLE